MSNIPAGYQIQIVTWENDADNYMTNVISGLTQAQAKMHYELAMFFVSGTNNKGKGLDGRGNYGNADVSYEGGGHGTPEGDRFSRNQFDETAFTAEFLEFCKDTGLNTEKFHGDLYETVVGTWCEGEYLRVVESIKVYYFPKEVKAICTSNL